MPLPLQTMTPDRSPAPSPHSSSPSQPASLASSTASLDLSLPPPSPLPISRIRPARSFDPTSPSSQILERPAANPIPPQTSSSSSSSSSPSPTPNREMPLDEDADPFTDPDAPSHLLAQTHRLPPPLPLSLATDKGKGKEHDMATSTPILRKPWSARAKVEGWYAAGARSHAALGGAPSKGKAGGVASQSYTGGVNQSFLQYVSFLSLHLPIVELGGSAKDAGGTCSRRSWVLFFRCDCGTEPPTRARGGWNSSTGLSAALSGHAAAYGRDQQDTRDAGSWRRGAPDFSTSGSEGSEEVGGAEGRCALDFGGSQRRIARDDGALTS